ncbi:MAG: Rho termination factor N-terminal domain-containing protein [Candidatus Odinarchaeota archaeon]
MLQGYNAPDLKSICKEYEIKGYSSLKKQELIHFIVDSLSEEEIKEFIQEHEQEILDKEFNIALSIIRKSTPEKLISLKVINQKLGELEVKFKGLKWETICFMSINKDNIDNPEWDCDCSIGSNHGFCRHFWTLFLFSLTKSFFEVGDWKLTKVPTNLAQIIKS